MGIRSIIRDIIFLYIAYRLLKAGIYKEALSNNDLLVFGDEKTGLSKEAIEL